MGTTNTHEPRSEPRTKLKSAALAILLALMSSVFVGMDVPTANAGYSSGVGSHCVKGWNNADWEQDYFWAATGNYKGDWYNAGYGACKKVNVQIRAYGEWCVHGWPGPGGITSQKTEYDGYVTRATYITPSLRSQPQSFHRAWTKGTGDLDTLALCYH